MVFFKISNTVPSFADDFGMYHNKFIKIENEKGNFDIYFINNSLNVVAGIVLMWVDYAVDINCWGFLINHKNTKATDEFKENVLAISMMMP